MKENPQYFYDNIKIGAIYGSFPNCIWNGGRVNAIEDPGIYNIEQTINELNNNYNMPVRFTWTNCLLNETHLDDLVCNYIMNCANNGMNEVIVNSPILEKYLREKYPKFKYISSTTKCILDNDKIIEESKKYYLTVLDYRKNDDINFLKSLKDKDKYEILINTHCDPKCKNRENHYRILSQLQLKNNSEKEEYCETFNNTIYDILKYQTVINEKKLYNVYYKELGFTNFKIEGRTNSIPEVLENYIYYMVKPEYKDIVRLNIM